MLRKRKGKKIKQSKLRNLNNILIHIVVLLITRVKISKDVYIWCNRCCLCTANFYNYCQCWKSRSAFWSVTGNYEARQGAYQPGLSVDHAGILCVNYSNIGVAGNFWFGRHLLKPACQVDLNLVIISKIDNFVMVWPVYTASLFFCVHVYSFTLCQFWFCDSLGYW